MRIAEGTTFTMPRYDGGDPHLYFVLNDPDSEGNFLIVNITSCSKPDKDDQTMTLSKADHPFIRRDSFVFYAKATVTNEDLIIRALREIDKCQQYKDADPDVLLDIKCGLFESEYTPEKIRKYFKHYFNYDEKCCD